VEHMHTKFVFMLEERSKSLAESPQDVDHGEEHERKPKRR
jgi:hypothetical protein